VNIDIKHCSEIQINKREAIRCKHDKLADRPIVRIPRLKSDACGNLRPVGHCFEFAERHLSGVTAMLQDLQGSPEGRAA
jgi:hypothetical protein